MRAPRPLPSLLAALVLAWPGALRAEEPRPIVVVATGRGPGADRVAAAVEELARQRVRADARFSLRSLRAPSAPSPEEALATAARHIAEGKRAYDELETELAVEHLERAVELLLAYIDALDDKSELNRALALLASVHHQSGETERAKEVFRLLATLSPSYALNEKEHPPSDARLLLEVQEELAFAEPGSARIAVEEGPSAAVWLDGTYRGSTPLSLRALEPGTHTYLLRREGYARQTGRLEVDRRDRQRVSLKLRPLEGQDTLHRALAEVTLVDGGGFAPGLARLAAAVGEPAELLVAVVEQAPEGERRRVRVARVLPERSLVLASRSLVVGEEDLEGALAPVLRELLDAPLPSAPVAVAPGGQAGGAAESDVDATGWIVAGATGGVLVLTAAVVGGVALWVSSQPPSLPSGYDPHHVARRQVLGF